MAEICVGEGISRSEFSDLKKIDSLPFIFTNFFYLKPWNMRKQHLIFGEEPPYVKGSQKYERKWVKKIESG